MIPIIAEVRIGQMVSAAETVAVIFASLGRNAGMAECSPGIGVRRKPAIKIPVAGIEAIVEALALNLAQLLRRRIPGATVQNRT
jgi:hypothetical protein